MMKNLVVLLLILSLHSAFLVSCGGQELQPIEEVTLTVDPETISEDEVAIIGRVLDFETGAPISQAVVSTSPPSEVVLSNERGEFVLRDDVFTGEFYRIDARADGYVAGNATALTTTERQWVDVELVDRDRAMPVLFFPEAPVFAPSATQVDLAIRSRVDEELSWQVHDAPPWLTITASQGQLGPHEMVWLALTLSPEEFAAASEGEDILYGTAELRDDRDRIALFHVAAVPAAVELDDFADPANPCETNNGGCPELTACVFDGGQTISCQNIDLCEPDADGVTACGPAEHWECVDRFGQEPLCIDIDHCGRGEHECDLDIEVCVNHQGAPSTCEPLNSIATLEILSGPMTLTNETTAELSFACSRPDCEFGCQLHGQAQGLVSGPTSCSSPMVYPDLDDDLYLFTVYLTDTDGGQYGAVQWSWFVDTIAPEVTILSGPDPFTATTSAEFDFECSKTNCEYHCQVSGNSEGLIDEDPSCDSPYSVAGLEDDDYEFTLFATDAAGNLSEAATWQWTVDNSIPNVVITTGPPMVSLENWATFEFQCTNKPNCSFECALDYDATATGTWQLGEWESCSSPHWIYDLLDGDYRFRLRATDDQDMVGMTQWEWTAELPGWIDLSAGSDHSCGITTDNALHCWGSGGSGRLGLGDIDDRIAPAQVGVDHDWLSVSAGSSHTCAIRVDGSLWCWGFGGSGRLGLGDTATHHTPQQVGDGQWISVSAGGAHTCAIDDDFALWCWGSHISGRLGLGDISSSQTSPQQVDSPHQWLQVSASALSHTCAIRQDETLWCWGTGSNGQLGQGTQSGFTTPVEVEVSPGGGLDEEVAWVSVATGWTHTCAVRLDGSLWCFGNGSDGQTGTGNTSSFVLTPELVTYDFQYTWTEVSAGHFHTCATRQDGSLWCWGQSSYGQIGHDSAGTDTTTPVAVDAGINWKNVSGGGSHTCGIDTDDLAHCWGYDYRGQLGLDIDAKDKLFPTDVLTERTPIQIDAGQDYGCFIADDHSLWCWGHNNFSKLGLDDRVRRPAPVQIGTGNDWLEVSVAQGYNVTPGSHICAVRQDGTLWCWGRGARGKLGHGDTFDRATPEQVGSDNDWASVATGTEHTCAIRDDQTLWCWGRNLYGQLGIGSNSEQNVPTLVNGDQWTQVSAATFTCAIRSDQTLWCWGHGSYGKLGLGDSDNRTSPVQVGERNDWVHVAAGYDHACAIDSTSTLWCWGRGGFGRLGLGDTDHRFEPEELSSGWLTVSAGYEHSCATQSDSRVYCWGRGTSGQLGRGTTSNHNIPQLVPDTGWVQVAAGGDFTVGFQSSGGVMAWGSNADGQLADGTALKRTPTFLEP